MLDSIKVALVVVGSTLVVACGGDDDSPGGGGGGRSYSQFEGIYETVSHTRNDNGCDAPGPSVLTSPAPMYASVAFTFFGYPGLSLTECPDLTSCQAEAADVKMNNFPPIFGGYSFDSVSGNSASGTVSYASSSGSGPCTGSTATHTITAEDDGSFTLEVRSIDVDNVPLDAEGGCDLDALQDLAEGQPCSTLEVIHAELVEAL